MSMGNTELSSLINEALLVVDFQQENFLFVANHDLFLCGYSPEKVKGLGFKFFEEALHPNDYPLWNDIRETIKNRINEDEMSADEINYFSFTLRFRCPLIEKKKNQPKKYIMVYWKLKPQWINGEPRLGICLLSGSVLQKSGNLCVYYKNRDHAEYNFKTGKWQMNTFSPLSKRERGILLLAHQGLYQKEKADQLGVKEKTVENIKSILFEKLGVSSLGQAVQYASNRRLIYHAMSGQSASVRKKNALYPSKKTRKRLNEYELADIQKDLNEGQSVNATAKKMDVPESSIRSLVKQGKLIKKRSMESH